MGGKNGKEDEKEEMLHSFNSGIGYVDFKLVFYQVLIPEFYRAKATTRGISNINVPLGEGGARMSGGFLVVKFPI